MNEEKGLMDIIHKQSQEIEKLEKEKRDLYIWIGVVSLASTIIAILAT